MELVPDSLVAGKLRVIRRLGGGPLSAIWEVEDTGSGQRLALKVLQARITDRDDVVDRFLSEAVAAGKLGNPHICPTIEGGRLESGAPYLLMELLEGRSLRDRLRRGPPVGLTELVRLVRQACLGIAATHEVGIVHRDLSPDNLFLTSVGGKTFTRLLGFGVSRFDELAPGEERLTPEGTTLRYLSPEQMSGNELDRRSDIYALGVILYEVAAGQPPFNAASVGGLAVQIDRGKHPSLRQLRPNLPPAFIDVVDRAMHVDRNARFQDALKLAEALAPFEREPSQEHVAVPVKRSLLWPVIAFVVPFALGFFAFLKLRTAPAPPPAANVEQRADPPVPK
jgi:eukaryotic-like serine/threonine-protein kinase